MMVLFACHANLNRSPRAAEVFRKFADQKGFDVEVQSAGTNAFCTGFSREALRVGFGVEHVTQFTDEILQKADITVALDDWVKLEIEKNHKVTPKKLVSLEVPDMYSLQKGNLDTLCKILNEKLEPLAEDVSLLQRTRPGKKAL